MFLDIAPHRHCLKTVEATDAATGKVEQISRRR